MNKIKTWALCFPAKEIPNMEKPLFHWPIVLQFDVKAMSKYDVRALSFQGHTKNAPITNIITNQRINVHVGKVSTLDM